MIYTKEELLKLNRFQQMRILDNKGIKHKSNIKESELIRLILGTNNLTKPIKEVVIKLDQQQLVMMQKVIEIAKAGFPDENIKIFIDSLEKELY